MTFPRSVPMWGNDRMVASLQVTVSDNESGETEEVALTSIMELRRASPARGLDGTRRVKVALRTWSAKGFSRLLGRSLEYRLSTVEQPDSLVEAEQPETDYPATMTFNAVFDVLVGGESVASGVEGTARASGLSVIPPRGEDRFDVNKSVEYGRFSFVAGACVASRIDLTARQRLLRRMLSVTGRVPEALLDA